MILDYDQCVTRLCSSIVNDADLDLIENLLRKMSNYDLNTFQWHGQSLIHLCCLYNRLDALELFVQSGQCDVQLINNDGWLPLHIAVYLGHMEIVQYLIQCSTQSNLCHFREKPRRMMN